MKRLLAIDAVGLAAYALAALPGFTGVPVHEWLGVGVFVVFLVHGAAHGAWVAGTIRPAGARVSPGRLGNFALDCALLLAFMTVTVSGLGVSGTVLHAFGLYVDGYFVWAPLHAIAAKVLLALLLVHVAVHAASLYNRLKRGGAPRRAGRDDGGRDDGPSA